MCPSACAEQNIDYRTRISTFVEIEGGHSHFTRLLIVRSDEGLSGFLAAKLFFLFR